MNITIFEDIRKEFSANDKGITYSQKRGLGRLCGVRHQSWGKRGYVFNKELDAFIIEELELNSSGSQNDVNNPFSLLDVLINKELIVVAKSGIKIQDVLCSLVIEFYATEKKIPEARKTNRALRAVGLRKTIQQTIGWDTPKREYGNFLLSTPRVWTKVFGDDFYDELSRLTGLEWDKKTHKKPCIFAQLTYDLVYKHLPKEVYFKIKQTQREHGGYIHKMHQFLNEDGLDALVNHLNKTLYIIGSTSSLETAKQLVTQSVTGIYQPSIFG